MKEIDAVIVYFNDRFMPRKEVKISPDDRGFVFADGAYEVIRAYNGKLFRAEDHLARLTRSLRELSIGGIDTKNLRAMAEKLLQENHLTSGDATVYIQVTRGEAPRKHAFPDQKIPLTVYAAASPFDPPLEKTKAGVQVILVPDIRWARCDIKSVALLPNVLANQQAHERQAAEAVFVRDGAVTEGTHTNFAAVFDKVLFTYPESHYILAGITRKVVLGLCRELEIPVKEFPVLEKELKKADELMLLGTTAEVMPVIQVNGWKVGDGTPGSITLRLQQALRELTQ